MPHASENAPGPATSGAGPPAEGGGRPLRVLFVEDSEDDVLLTLRQLRRDGYRPTFRRVERAEEMRQALNEEWDIILSDYTLPEFSGQEALKIYNESGSDAPYIILSGTIGEDAAVAALKAGAHDYVHKDNLARLAPVIDRELREQAERRARQRAEEALRAAEEEKKRFYREVVLAVTGGHLLLHERDELTLPCDGEALPVRGPQEVRDLRIRVREAAIAAGLPPERADDLEVAAAEAMANAWKHAGCGLVRICSGDGGIQVMVQDHGQGIAPENLARAAFEKGFSTAQTLGVGFSLMLGLTDRVHLVTDGQGTTVVLQMERHPSPPPAPPW
ncbi:MAG: response regulator [Armatimonadetes bacterium]|jgi:anti-sigma regulatory factor (Ser/Thr protein kinase)/DNA-binding response OmpR family regulator|nr:response regulator [Armatimonadota bacterium]